MAISMTLESLLTKASGEKVNRSASVLSGFLPHFSTYMCPGYPAANVYASDEEPVEAREVKAAEKGMTLDFEEPVEKD